MTHARARGLITGGIAAAGLVAGHLVDYLLVAPHGAHRGELLRATGHGYLPRAAAIAFSCAVVAVLATAMCGLARGRGRLVPRRTGRMALHLASIQVPGFVLLEVLERRIAGAPLGDLVGTILGLGILVQLVAAVAGAALLRAVERYAEALGRTLAAIPGGRRAGPPMVSRRERPLRSRLVGAASQRGPPSSPRAA